MTVSNFARLTAGSAVLLSALVTGQAWAQETPVLPKIQDSLNREGGSFSETLPEFVELRDRVPASWKEILKGVSMRSYLNERDMKEYALEIDDHEG